MYDLALEGDPWAQREYATMLRWYDKAKETFKASYEEAEVDQQIEYGIEVGTGYRVHRSSTVLQMRPQCCTPRCV